MNEGIVAHQEGTVVAMLGALQRLIVRTSMNARWFNQVPILLHRAGLGAVMGSRYLLLEHTGRKSGQVRYNMLEIFGRPAPDEVVVSSSKGEKSQWFRNIAAEPRVHITIGRMRRMPATARVLDPADGAVHFERFRQKHPKAWTQVYEPLMLERAGRALAEKEMAEHFPVIEFQIGSEP